MFSPDKNNPLSSEKNISIQFCEIPRWTIDSVLIGHFRLWFRYRGNQKAPLAALCVSKHCTISNSTFLNIFDFFTWLALQKIIMRIKGAVFKWDRQKYQKQSFFNGCTWYRSVFIEQWKHDVRAEGHAVCVSVCVCRNGVCALTGKWGQAPRHITTCAPRCHHFPYPPSFTVKFDFTLALSKTIILILLTKNKQ